jgi:PAS domain S-box-containing protein
VSCLVLLSYALGLRALAPLQRLAAFSRRLTDRPGSFYVGHTPTREVADLAGALNEASLRLEAQLDAVGVAQERLTAMLGAMPDALIGLSDRMTVTLVNPAITSLFGLQPEEVIGQPLQRLIPALDAARFAEVVRGGALMSSTGVRVARLEANGLRHEGTAFPIEVSISDIAPAGDTCYACVVRDLTEKRWADDQLRLFNRALDASRNGVVIASMVWPGAPVVYANPAFADITGWSREDIIGRNCRILQADDRVQPGVALLREAIAAGQPVQTTLRNYRRDGTPFFNELSLSPVADAQGSLTHYIGVINDVTQREAARRALADRSARLDTIFKLSPDCFVLFDGDGWLAYCNPAFLEITGWQADRVIGVLDLATFDSYFSELCDPSIPYDPIVVPLDDHRPGPDEEVTLEMHRPQRRTLKRTVRRTMTESGETILFFRDVTRESEVDRMKSEFLTTAAHELRTPMASIFGFSELLLRRQVPDERRKDMLETIHRQASWLINMLNELLDLARIEARQGKDLKPEPVRIAELVSTTLGSLLVPGDPRQVQWEVDDAAVDLAVHVDPEKTRQALLNVLSNAYKYSPAGGEVRLSTPLALHDGVRHVGIRVQDQGIGMTAAQMARVCERFYRADPSGSIPGTGLGMSLVKEIVELQGGRVAIQSEYGVGTVVTIWLPLAGAGP